jgi:hypothetical protein
MIPATRSRAERISSTVTSRCSTTGVPMAT